MHRTARTIGKRVTPSPALASGSWELSEVDLARRAATWAGDDPYFGDVALLMQETLADTSSAGQSVTAIGTAGTTSTSRFGSTGFVGYDVNNYVQVASSASLAFGSADFTVEMFLNFPSYLSNTYYSIWTCVNNTSNSNRLNLFIQTGEIRASIYGNIFMSAAVSLSSNTWHHVAYSCSNGTLRAFVDGVEKAQAATPVAFAQDTYRLPFSTTAGQTIHFDDVRITVGGSAGARYTANFTPPTYPHAAHL